MKALNYSKQRQAIIDDLRNRCDHPTADEIYKNVQTALPNISLGTVYRNLNLLTERGVVRKVQGLDGSEHFDADMSEHPHFICSRCGSVEDIFLEAPELLSPVMADARQNCSGMITGQSIYFYGICCRCKNK